MSRKTTFENLLKLTATLCAAGTLFASSCGAQGFRAVGAGIDAATGYLDDEEDGHQDISFGDWLVDEFED